MQKEKFIQLLQSEVRKRFNQSKIAILDTVVSRQLDLKIFLESLNLSSGQASATSTFYEVCIRDGLCQVQSFDRVKL